MSAVPITKLPPMPARGILPPEPAFHHLSRPVAVEFGTDDEIRSNGIDFTDYSRMQVRQRKQSGERRLPTPSWALRPSEFQQLLSRFLEIRAGVRYPRIDSPAKRIRFAERKLLAQVPKKFEVIDHLSREYVALRNSGGSPKRLRQLEIQIENVDSSILLARRGAAVVAAVVYLYYRAGLDSVGVAGQLHLKPPAIRALLHRLSRVWQRMQDGSDRKPTAEEIRRAQIREAYRRNPTAQRERSRLRRAAMSTEQREAFRKYNHEYNRENRETIRPMVRAWKQKNRQKLKGPSEG